MCNTCARFAAWESHGTIWKSIKSSAIWRQQHTSHVDASAASDLRSARLLRSAITHAPPLSLPSLNHIQMTLGHYGISTHTSTHIVLVGYNSVFCCSGRWWITGGHQSCDSLPRLQLSFQQKWFGVLFLEGITEQTVLLHPLRQDGNISDMTSKQYHFQEKHLSVCCHMSLWLAELSRSNESSNVTGWNYIY